MWCRQRIRMRQSQEIHVPTTDVAPDSALSSRDELPRQLQRLCEPWAPAERPTRWLRCPELAPSALGKWQRRRWREWMDELKADQKSRSASADVDSF